ncbi:hypothetical protein Nmel_006797 [Mimus melanotis]
MAQRNKSPINTLQGSEEIPSQEMELDTSEKPSPSSLWYPLYCLISYTGKKSPSSAAIISVAAAANKVVMGTKQENLGSVSKSVQKDPFSAVTERSIVSPTLANSILDIRPGETLGNSKCRE